MPPLPAYILSVEHLLHGYIKQGISRDQAWTLAARALLCDARFKDNTSPHLEAVRNYVITPQRLAHARTIPLARRRKLYRSIAHNLVGLALRPTDHLTIAHPHRASTVFAQTYAHVATQSSGGDEHCWSLADGYTLSSKIAKRDERQINRHSRDHGANSAYITADNRLIAWRSARSDTAYKLEEKLVGSACAALTAASGDKAQATGWRQTKNGWEYQAVLITAMDKSWVKHIYGLVMRLFGGEARTERMRLRELNAARREMFATQGRAGRCYTIEVNGVREKVFIRPPQIVNITLSGQSRNPHRLREARADNRDAALAIGAQLIDTLRRRDQQDAATLVDQFVFGTARQDRPALLQSSAYRAAFAALPPRLQLGMEWLHLMLAKTTLHGDRLLGATDPGVEAMLIKYLADEDNLATIIECKSGVDRTQALRGHFRRPPRLRQSPRHPI